MKYSKIFILLAAAGSGALIFKVRHPDDELSTATAQYQYQEGQASSAASNNSAPVVPDDRNAYSTLTGDGSIYQTLQNARKEAKAGNTDYTKTKPSHSSSGAFGNHEGATDTFTGGLGKVGSGGGKAASGYGTNNNNNGSFYSNNDTYVPADDVEILQAAAKGDKLTVQRRIAAGVKIDSRDGERRTPLMYAAANGFEEIIDRLTAAGANPNFKDRYGNNAFDYACGRGLVETVQYMLERTHSKDDRNYVEFAQTIRAVYAGDVSLLPPGTGKLASVNRTTPDGQAPLHIAAGNGSVAVITALIKRGAEVNLTNRNQQTPLHWAAWNNQAGSAEALLDNGACVYQSEASGNTPLMLAAQSNSKDVAKVLLNKGAEKEMVNKRDGKTAAMQAEDRGFRELSTILK